MKFDKNILSQFIGTEAYHRWNSFSRFSMTDGVYYMAEAGNCFWLFDIVASAQYLSEIKRHKSFIVWRIEVAEDSSCVVTAYLDGPYVEANMLYRQRVPRTDFATNTGLTEFNFWQEGNILLLPSEH